jgi:uncharacterized protein with PhoU and TrkA domain
MGDISLRGRGIVRVGLAKGTLPDFNNDGEITQADVLIGRGVSKKPKSSMIKKADTLTAKMSKDKKGRAMKKGKR